jgi:hypothetical protein
MIRLTASIFTICGASETCTETGSGAGSVI